MNRRQFFDRQAATWDRMVPMDLITRIADELFPQFGIKRGERVLDIGCGTGILLPLLKKAVGGKGEVVALDYSMPMLRKAEEKFGGWYSYVCADAARIPLPDGCFDAVICYSVFPHFPRKLAVLKECRRLLADGGRLIIAHLDSRGTINSFHWKVGGPVGRDFLPEDTEMLSLLKKAGFRTAAVRDEAHRYLASAVA